MTFERFQATKKDCSDLGAALNDSMWDGEPPAEGLIYLDALYIEKVSPHWPESARNQGKWHLIINRDEWISDDLTTLEHKLYDFAVSEGFFN